MGVTFTTSALLTAALKLHAAAVEQINHLKVQLKSEQADDTQAIVSWDLGEWEINLAAVE